MTLRSGHMGNAFRHFGRPPGCLARSVTAWMNAFASWRDCWKARRWRRCAGLSGYPERPAMNLRALQIPGARRPDRPLAAALSPGQSASLSDRDADCLPKERPAKSGRVGDPREVRPALSGRSRARRFNRPRGARPSWPRRAPQEAPPQGARHAAFPARSAQRFVVR